MAQQCARVVLELDMLMLSCSHNLDAVAAVTLALEHLTCPLGERLTLRLRFRKQTRYTEHHLLQGSQAS